MWWMLSLLACSSGEAPSAAVLSLEGPPPGPVLDEMPECAAAGELDMPAGLQFVKPPLDEDGVICEVSRTHVRVLHTGPKGNAVPNRYARHYAEHGWTVSGDFGGLRLEHPKAVVDVKLAYFTGGTAVEFAIRTTEAD